MTTADRPTRRTDTAVHFAAIHMVPDGDGFIVGSPASRQFVAVPAIGGQVIRWLQAGYSLDECTALASAEMRQAVDVAGFVDGLTQVGIVAADADPVGPAPADAPSVSRRAARAGRILFGPVGLCVQAGLTLCAALLMVTQPRVRPTFTDAVVGRVPLVSLVLVAATSLAIGLLHELMHVIAAAARGVPGRVSISRRMVTIVYQTDLTRLWGVPRRSRVVPLLAGVLNDAATVGLLMAMELLIRPHHHESLVAGIRLVVFVKLAGIFAQTLIFMRTDLYALLVVATGCRNLWQTKGSLARRMIGLANDDDLRHLASTSRKELAVARAYLLLYLPGVLWTAWYFTILVLPAAARLVRMSLEEITEHGLLSGLGLTAGIALLIQAVSMGFIVNGLLRTGRRILASLGSRSRNS